MPTRPNREGKRFLNLRFAGIWAREARIVLMCKSQQCYPAGRGGLFAAASANRRQDESVNRWQE